MSSSTDLPPPGPERDRLVAEALGIPLAERCWVFKQGWCDGTTLTHCGACGGDGHGNCYGRGNGPIQVACEHRCDAPSPSTSDHAAYDALEAWLAQRPGRWVTIHLDGWRPSVTLGDVDHADNCSAPTLGDAASRAIIEAKRREG